MKLNYFNDVTNQSDDDLPAAHLPALEQEFMQAGWLFWAVHLLAEGACAVAALFAHLSLFGSEPIYMGGFALIAYLAQGVYQVKIKTSRLSRLMDHVIWWRQAIAILGWPVHQAIVEFLVELQKADEQDLADSDWMNWTLFLAIGRWVSVWWLTVGISVAIALVIERVGLLS